MAVFAVAVIAALLAWNRGGTILDLVAFAWAGFGAGFGPTVLLCLYWRRLTAAGAFAGMIVGAVLVMVWGNLDGGPGGLFDLYEIVPGFLGNLAVAWAVSRAGRPDRKDAEISRVLITDGIGCFSYLTAALQELPRFVHPRCQQPSRRTLSITFCKQATQLVFTDTNCARQFIQANMAIGICFQIALCRLRLLLLFFSLTQAS